MPINFGSPIPNVHYVERRAAYVVILNGEGEVALVKGSHKHFLPGGSSLPGERPEATVAREVNEEVARRVHLVRTIGEAIQYFYSETDKRHYRMLATFFAGIFDAESDAIGHGEHELKWLPKAEVEQACFHACHAWAVHQA